MFFFSFLSHPFSHLSTPSLGYQVKTDEVRGALMFRNFEWDAKKAQILEKYTVKDQIQMSFMQDLGVKVCF